MKFQVPSLLSVSVPDEACRLVTFNEALSISAALAKSSASVITRRVSSTTGVSITGAFVGMSLTGITVTEEVPACDN